MKIPFYNPTFSALEKETQPKSHQTYLSDDGRSIDFGLFVENLESQIEIVEKKITFPKIKYDLIHNNTDGQTPMFIDVPSNVDKYTELDIDIFHKLDSALETHEATSTNITTGKNSTLSDVNAFDFDNQNHTANATEINKDVADYESGHTLQLENLADYKKNNIDSTSLKFTKSLEVSEEFHNSRETKNITSSYLPSKENLKSFLEIPVSNIDTENHKFQKTHHTPDSLKANEGQRQERVDFDPLAKKTPVDRSYPIQTIAPIEPAVAPTREVPLEPTTIKNDPHTLDPNVAFNAKVITSPIVRSIDPLDTSLNFDRLHKNAAPALKPDTIGEEPMRSAISVQPSFDGTDIKFMSPNKDLLDSMLRHQQELRAAFRDLGLENYTFSFQDSGSSEHDGAQKQTTLAIAGAIEMTPDRPVTYDVHPQSGLDIRI